MMSDDRTRWLRGDERIKGVLDVCPITADPMLVVAEARVRTDFQIMICEWLNAKTKV